MGFPQQECWSGLPFPPPQHTVALISHDSKVILRILQTRLPQYTNPELPHIEAELRKGRGTTNQMANIHWIIEKGKEYKKNIYFCFIDYAKAFDCMDQKKKKTGKFLKRWEYQTTLLIS